MRQAHDDYLKGGDDAAQQGANRQLGSLEVWFDLKNGIRHTRSIVGLGLAAKKYCSQLRLAPIRQNPSIEPISEVEYVRRSTEAQHFGHAYFLREAGRNPKSPEWDLRMVEKIIDWAGGPLVGSTGIPLTPMPFPESLRSRFTTKPE